MLRRYRYVFLLAAVALLLLPLLPDGLPIHGVEVFGSRLWVRIELPLGGRTLSFQPGEIAKVLLTIFLASYLADRYLAMASGPTASSGRSPLPDLRQLFPVVLAGAAAFLVLIYQRDLGASLLLFGLFIGMMYIATGRGSYLAIGAVFVGMAGFAAYRMFDHVERRVMAWLRPFEDFADSGYQIAQSLFALGSGSITGSGIGLGRPDLIPAAAHRLHLRRRRRGDRLRRLDSGDRRLFTADRRRVRHRPPRPGRFPQVPRRRAHPGARDASGADHRRGDPAAPGHRHHPARSCRTGARRWSPTW